MPEVQAEEPEKESNGKYIKEKAEDKNIYIDKKLSGSGKNGTLNINVKGFWIFKRLVLE